MKVIASWSGGKDSCLACYKAMEAGHSVYCLLNFISREHKRGCFHGIESKLLKAQARCMGIPLVQKEVSSDMANYEREFKEAITGLKKSGIEGMVFGDVYLDEHREWVERVCKELEIKPVEPLWHVKPEKVVSEFIGIGFKAVIVSAKADLFSKDWVGRQIDSNLLAEIRKKNICPCGENGEFHTFVYDGPLFKNRIKITRTRKILKNGFWKHRFLDIKDYRIIIKNEKGGN